MTRISMSFSIVKAITEHHSFLKIKKRSVKMQIAFFDVENSKENSKRFSFGMGILASTI